MTALRPCSWSGWQGRVSPQAGCGSGPTLSPVCPGSCLPHGLIAMCGAANWLGVLGAWPWFCPNTWDGGTSFRLHHDPMSLISVSDLSWFTANYPQRLPGR